MPENVKVLSLGKETQLRERSGLKNFKRPVLEEQLQKFKYLWNFYRHIWRERKNYDTVFVHMNQEYVILGWKFWKLWRKKIWLWRNHPKGSFLTSFAVFVSNRVFCTSKFSYTARFKKTEIMPVGVDTELFSYGEDDLRQENSILFLGRISVIKRPEVFIRACGQLASEGMDFKADMVGDPAKGNEGYYEDLKSFTDKMGLNERVTFRVGVENRETRALYRRSDVYVNLTPSGSFDKTIIEAMACGCLTLTCNKNLSGEVDPMLVMPEDDIGQLGERIKNIFELSSLEKNKMRVLGRSYAVSKHGLKKLAVLLFRP